MKPLEWLAHHPRVEDAAQGCGAPLERESDGVGSQTLHVWLPSGCAEGAAFEFLNTL
jgi:hypothetical protein